VRKEVLVVLLVLAMMLVSGCTFNEKVSEYEVGLDMDGGVDIVRTLPAGRYTRWGFFDNIETVDVSAKTVQWEDPDLVTSDKQEIGFSLQVTYARDKTKVEEMWSDYHTEAVNDEALKAQVLGRIPRVSKAVTTQFTLNEMLGIDEEGTIHEELGRYLVQEKVFNLLEEELSEINVVLLDVGINNIAPDAEYMDLLARKATAQVSVEVAREEKTLADVQVLTEEAQTEVALERARRARLVAQENAKVYETNPGWLQLQIWEAAKEVFSGDTVWFLDPNADITLLFTGESSVLPVSPGE